MAVLAWWSRITSLPEIPNSAPLALRDETRRRQLVHTILLVVACLQLAELPGAFINHSLITLGTGVLGLSICGVAMLFNSMGRATVGSLLLIMVIDLGCGLMLLTLPNGLDVGNLPVFDVLIVSELIAVSLLPAVSVFPVALGNILFIIGDIIIQPHTPALQSLLASSMAYDALLQPISLQAIVAVVTYLWVRSALRAIARADRAEEVAELQRREAEHAQQLEIGIQQLLQTQVRAANGDLTARANLSQDNVLWQVGLSLNLLLTRLQKAGRAEYENQRLRAEVARLSEAVREMKAGKYFTQ